MDYHRCWKLFSFFGNSIRFTFNRGDYMAHFEVKNLSFSYATSPEKVALKEISILIEQGAYITICGKSGSGKTTLLRHLKSVLTPY